MIKTCCNYSARNRTTAARAILLYKQCVTSLTCLFFFLPKNDPPITADERRCSACGFDTPGSSVSYPAVRPRHSYHQSSSWMLESPAERAHAPFLTGCLAPNWPFGKQPLSAPQ